jgi:replicative DNA helicase
LIRSPKGGRRVICPEKGAGGRGTGVKPLWREVYNELKPMNEAKILEQKIAMEEELAVYRGADRVVIAEEKKKEILEEEKIRPKFIARTGIPSLDDTLGGFRKGWLIIMSGPPKHGKSGMCQTFTKRFLENKIPCLWLQYELGYREFFEKFPMDNLDFAVPNYMETGNLEWVERKIIESKRKYGTDVVFIDHLDFLRDPRDMRNVQINLATYVGGIVQNVKTMAVRHDVVIFLMCHIRKNEWKTSDVPSSEELRDSGQVAQLADIVMMMVRRRAKRESDTVYIGNEATLAVVENRHNGKTKKIPVIFNEDKKEFFEFDWGRGEVAPPKNEWQEEINPEEIFK